MLNEGTIIYKTFFFILQTRKAAAVEGGFTEAFIQICSVA